MGVYINPRNESKEVFLNREAEPVGSPSELDFDGLVKKGMLPVILVNNGGFTAAGIGYDKREWDGWLSEKNDGRPKEYFIIEKEKLYDVSNLKDYE